MKKLHFDYYMQIDYSEIVSKCHFTIKCVPQSDKRQSIQDVAIDVFPASGYSEGVDGLGNKQIYGVNEVPHDTFYYHITGTALTGLMDYEEDMDEDTAMIFGHPHGLNVAGERIHTYFQAKNPKEERDPYRKAIRLMNRLYKDFTYEANSTTIFTTAEEAFSQGKGVCQDYAHIFIALLHLAGIPARYVTGLIVGEGASHAWVEILYQNKWYGLDPTNNMLVTDEHVKIGVGRDANDCMINRGIMHGGGLHTQTIKVNVREMPL